MIVLFEGQPHTFPDDATDEEVAAALDALAPAPKMPPATRLATSQGDVRKTEPFVSDEGKTGALADLHERQRQYNVAFKNWTAAGGPHASRAKGLSLTDDAGRPKDDRTLAAEWSGIAPITTAEQDKAEMSHLHEGGAIGDVYGTDGAYAGAKVLAAVAGGRGGPLGAAGAEIIPRLVAVTNAVTKGVQAGAIDQDQAVDIVIKEVAKGFATDAAFNVGVPALSKVVGHYALKLPGAKWLADRAQEIAAKAVQRATQGMPAGELPAAAQTARQRKIEARTKLVPDNPERQDAIRELGEKLPDDKMMTPGSVTDEPGLWESNVRKARPTEMARMDKAMEGAADDMLRARTTPPQQMEREDLGRVILETAEKTQAATKQRLAPVFEAADNLGVKVDMTEAARIAKEGLRDRTLSEGDRKALEEVLKFVHRDPLMPRSGGDRLISPAEALDFISKQKAVTRSSTADWKPSEQFNIITNKIIKSVDSSYERSARIAGEPQVARDLLRARQDYRNTMETVYEDAIKAALKKNPEDVGKLLFGAGNVAEIKQLNRLLSLAQKEGVMGKAGSEKVRLDVARGWLQTAVKNLDDAANWTQMLKESPEKRDTWRVLTQGPGGAELQRTMRVIEQAAQMANKKNIMPAGEIKAVSRAASGSFGQSFYSGEIKIPMYVTGLQISGLVRAAATAYTHGDKGTLNGIMKILRANDVGTPAAAKGAQAAFDQLRKFAAENDIELETKEQE